MTTPPVRVCFLNDHLGYEGESLHGVSRYFLNVVPRLDRSRVDPFVAFLRPPDPRGRFFAAQGISVEFVGRPGPAGALRLLRLLRRRGVQIIHAQGYAGTTLARLLKPLSGARVVIHSHEADDRYPRVMRVIDWLLAGREDAALANSGDALRFFEEQRRIPAGRTRLLYNGLDLEVLVPPPEPVLRAVRAELALADDAEIVVTLTRFRPEKGNAILLRAVPELARRRPRVVVVFAGDGPDLAACRAQASALGIEEHVRFPGFRDDATALLSIASAAVVPSLREGTCYALLESLAMGVPSVATRVGGPSEVVEDGVSGVLVPAGDPAPLAHALAEVLAAPERARQLAEGGRRRAAAFDVRRHAATLADLYAGLASR